MHDPQHKPVADAAVKLKSATSDWTQTAQSDLDGAFTFTTVPLGDYVVTVTKDGFATMQQTVTVISGSSPILHFPLTIAAVNQTTVVTAQAGRGEYGFGDAHDAGRSRGYRPNSRRRPHQQHGDDHRLRAGAYVTHDMLHMRGGHQVDWLIDGVPIPNTNIATNLGPQIDPKDIDYLEVQRGSYDADYGDRTYGIFNIVPRTGFERDNEAELVTIFRQLVSNQRSNQFRRPHQALRLLCQLKRKSQQLRLQTPIGQVFHDAENGYGGFASFIFNPNPTNQFRLVTSLRQDYYQIPIDPDPNSSGNQVYPSYGLRDGEHETDGYVAFSWIHTFNPNLLLTVSPFYHYNQANYQASPNDMPVSTNADQTSNYGGRAGVSERNCLEK